ncbi:DUF3820 family protein [Salmonella enterica subsp. enterica]|nr:DUF3820 family protein [Salmonella enterica subsp. enterica]
MIDRPSEEYLLWFARKDRFPAGKEAGELMQITLLKCKTEG